VPLTGTPVEGMHIATAAIVRAKKVTRPRWVCGVRDVRRDVLGKRSLLSRPGMLRASLRASVRRVRTTVCIRLRLPGSAKRLSLSIALSGSYLSQPESGKNVYHL